MNEEKISTPGFTTPETPSGAPQPSGSGLQQMAKGTAQTAKAKIETLKSAAHEQGGAVVTEIKTVAQSATRQAQEAGRNFIDEQKENLAQKVDQYVDAMRAACERLRSEEGNVLVGPAQKAVDQLEQMSGYLREKQPADFLDDLESYARRRPEVVFGGFFVVGLAAARFFKASRKRPHPGQASRERRPTNRAEIRAFPTSQLQLLVLKPQPHCPLGHRRRAPRCRRQN